MLRTLPLLIRSSSKERVLHRFDTYHFGHLQGKWGQPSSVRVMGVWVCSGSQRNPPLAPVNSVVAFFSFFFAVLHISMITGFIVRCESFMLVKKP